MCSGIAGAHGDALSLHSAALPQLAERRRAPVGGGRLLHAMGKCILSEGHNWHLFCLLSWVQLRGVQSIGIGDEHPKI